MELEYVTKLEDIREYLRDIYQHDGIYLTELEDMNDEELMVELSILVRKNLPPRAPSTST